MICTKAHKEILHCAKSWYAVKYPGEEKEYYIIHRRCHMTSNQVAYWSLQEEKRHNRAQENEMVRSNTTREQETERSNKSRESLEHAKNLLSREKMDQEATFGILDRIWKVVNPAEWF